MARGYRPDQQISSHRRQFEANKKKLLATQNLCGICGKPVDKRLKWPDPMCGVIDHIVPVSKGGHPSDIKNLQLAHMCCNRAKSDKLFEKKDFSGNETISNRALPQSFKWIEYRSKK